MYKRISGWKFFLLNIVTFNIYGIYIWSKLGSDHNKMAEKVRAKTLMPYIVAFLLGCITFGIVPLIWNLCFFSQMATLNEKKGAGLTPKNWFLMFLMSCIPVYSCFWVAKTHNKLAEVYEAPEITVENMTVEN